jgi:hypothetical protein
MAHFHIVTPFLSFEDFNDQLKAFVSSGKPCISTTEGVPYTLENIGDVIAINGAERKETVTYDHETLLKVFKIISSTGFINTVSFKSIGGGKYSPTLALLVSSGVLIDTDSKYLAITTDTFSETIKDRFQECSGTYVLHWFDRGKPKTTSRLIKNDPLGRLYIGETSKPLYERVSSLRDALLANDKDQQLDEPKEKGHQALSKKFFRIRKHFNVEDLYVSIQPLKWFPKKDESYLIEKYVAECGELPPLNGNYGSHAFWEFFRYEN